MNAARRPLPRSVLLALTVAGFALRAFHMNAQSLWFDEIGSARIATMPVDELVAAAEHGTVEPTAWLSTAYYALVKAVLLLPHASPDALLRSTSVALGTATIPTLAWATAAFLPVRAVLATTTLLAFSPFHIWYSQEVRPYALLVLIATGLMGAAARALLSGAIRWWTFVAVLVALALYTHPIALALPVIVGVGLLAVGVSAPRRALAGVAALAAAGLAAAGLAYVPLLLWIGRHGANHPADLRPVGWLDVPYAFYAYAVGFSLGPSTSELHAGTLAPVVPHLPVVAFTALVFAGLALRGALATRALPAAVRVLLWAWLVVPLGLALAVAVASANPFNVRYAIVSFPAFVVLIGLGAAEGRGGVLGGLALLLAGVALANLYFDPRYAKEDTRSLARLLATEARADDLVVVNAAYMASAVTYYYSGSASVIGFPPEPEREVSPARAAELIALSAGHPHVWLVQSRTFHGDRAGVLDTALASRLTRDREQRFDGILVQRFSPR